MAATGDQMNVLKIKPPLCIDESGVDHLLAALEVAFTEGWRPGSPGWPPGREDR
jgi:4-aminobutyrate aminotransferase-like enzyme